MTGAVNAEFLLQNYNAKRHPDVMIIINFMVKINLKFWKLLGWKKLQDLERCIHRVR